MNVSPDRPTPTYSLADLFELVVDAVPDRLALVAGDVRLTYRELEARANRLAHVLAERGIGAGDHIAIYAWNRAEWVEAWWASYKLRAVPINVNYRYVGDELRYVLDNADAKAVLYEPEFGELLDSVRPGLPALQTVLELGPGYEAALAGASEQRNFPARSSDDRYLLYTGGTTGMSKGVEWRHEDIFFAALGGQGYGGLVVTDPTQLAERSRLHGGNFRTLIVPPLMHGAAQWGACNAFSGFLGGATVILYVGHRFDADAVWDLVERERATGINIVGDAMGRPLVEALESSAGARDLGSLASFGSGGAVLSPHLKDRLKQALPGVAVVDSFGASETGAGGSPADPTATRPRFRLGAGVAVLDDDLRPLRPGSDVVGRMARSGYIPLGYYKDPEKTAATFVTASDGRRYVVPGDHATVEADGLITLLGRGSQCINTGGEKVFPEEVESVIREHPAVVDALVVGLADERFGERVSAVVAVRPGGTITLADLQNHCRSKLAGYKLPRELTLTDAVPRSPAGKADYRRAKALAEAE